MANVLNESLIGNRYGQLTIVSLIGKQKHSILKVEAKCDCGVIKEYFYSNLSRAHTTSCGCVKKKNSGIYVKTHGLTNHILYGRWCAMLERCYNKNKKDYHRYGGNGVKVCDSWRYNFQAYYDWCIANGWEQGLQIDKDIKGDGLLYSPDTCSIVTSKQNNNNRSNNIIVNYNGELITLKQVAEKYKVRYLLLWNRYVKLKWDIEKAIITPPKILKNVRPE